LRYAEPAQQFAAGNAGWTLISQTIRLASGEDFSSAGAVASVGRGGRFSRTPSRSKQSDGVWSYERVGRSERQTVSLRLTDQHAVEGKAMEYRQSAQLGNGCFIQSR